MSKKDGLITIKKYANRRLYNTDSSSYVTLEFLSQMVRDGIDFVVLDAKSGEDITRQVLTQIIFEAENSGSNLLSVKFLRDLIGFYGKSVQGFFPSYLEMSVKNFSQSQEQWKNAFLEKAKDSPLEMFAGAMKTNMKTNLEVFSKASQAMTNLATHSFSPTAAVDTANEVSNDALKMMQEQMKAMQAQLDKMAKKD